MVEANIATSVGIVIIDWAVPGGGGDVDDATVRIAHISDLHFGARGCLKESDGVFP